MKIAISGSSGMIGSALVERLRLENHQVARIRRGEASGDDIRWQPNSHVIEADKLEDMEVVIHLAGESIADGRWTAAKKERIRKSRVEGTTFLCETLAGLSRKPHTLVSASAIGFYGDRGQQACDEETSSGDGFLAEVCVDWENATKPALDAGLRVVITRIGVVLSPKGGALAKMLLPFKLGAGGVVGRGFQHWSWISLDDVVGAMVHCLHTNSLHGPVNLVSPGPVTNAEFTKALGRVLRRPTFIPMPAFAARLLLGEMANDLLLASTRVVPKRLQEIGYGFQHSTIDAGLTGVLA